MKYIITINKLYYFRLSLLMYKWVEKLTKHTDIHYSSPKKSLHHNTQEKLFIYQSKTIIMVNKINFHGPKIWNSLPKALKLVIKYLNYFEQYVD